MRKFIYLFALLYLLLPHTATAQMQVSSVPMTILGGPSSYAAMLQQLFGAGVVVSNVQIGCDTLNRQAGWFTATGTNIGLSQGMLLTSGDIDGAVGPNSQTGYTGNVTTAPGDATLTQAAGINTFDACKIEFDVIPYCDTLSIKYVFASDEYVEFSQVGGTGGINDAFGFFVTGPNPAGGNFTNQNIALIPNQTLPVTINNVNCAINGQYYICNDQNSVGGFGGVVCAPTFGCPGNNTTTTVEYDGFTTVLRAVTGVVPCQSYHVKIVIGDGADHILDSGVFLEAGGVGCSGNLLNVNVSNSIGAGGNYAVEGCVDGVFTFTLPAPLTVADTFVFQLGGSATEGVDYQAGAVPDTLIIPAGSSSASIIVPIISDFLQDGGETIQLIYTDSSLCGSVVFVDTFTLYILDPPVVSAGPDKVLCSGDTITMGVPPSFGHGYTWTPNTGIILGTDTLSTAFVSLTNNTGVPYTMTYLFADSAGLTGCVSYDTVLVVVNPSVTADFTAPNVCYGETAAFTNTSTPNSVAWSWNFGDGSPVSTQYNAANYYASAGTYNVQLIVGSAFGCLDTIVQPITIYPKPVADFSTANICFGNAASFTDLTNIPINQYAWDFGNGLGFSGLQNPTYLYPNPGNYNVQLITATLEGCLDTVVKPVQIYEPINAGFVAPAVCYENTTQFTNTSAVLGGTYTSVWDFGDTQTSTQNNPSHLYANAGIYNVVLIVTTNNGCKDTINQLVTVYPKPIAAFTAPPVCHNLASQFTDNTGTATQWQWNMGNATGFSTQNVSYIYPASGIYQVQLIVTNSDGCKDTVVKPVEVYALPVSDFVVENECIYDNFVFQNQSTQGTNAINTYSWNFGDTQTSAQTAPTHLYGLHGAYTVTLVTTDVFGCADTLQKPIEVYAKPTAQFGMNNVCQDATVNFVNGSTVAAGSININRWEFGDGNGSLSLSPDHIYTTPGVFYVELLVVTEHTCVDSLTRTVTIFPKPTPLFEVDAVCWGDESSFLDNSLITPIVANDIIVAWNWDMGDGTNDVLQSPSHLYSEPGSYSVTLTLTTDKGCERSITKSALVNVVPIEPIINNDTVCLGGDASLSAVAPNGVKVNWYYTPTDSLPFHTGYQYFIENVISAHQYYVQAIQLSGGCKSPILEINAQVFNESNQSLQISDSLVYVPTATVSFWVASDIEIINYNWAFGDGYTSTSNSPTPVHQYQYPGRYTVTLTTTDKNGCEKTLTQTITVKEVFGIQVPSAFTPNEDLVNDVFFVGAFQVATFRIDVYNRWGQSVFSSENPDFRWDGKTQNGKACPEGVYVYKISAISSNGKPINKSGTITLTR